MRQKVELHPAYRFDCPECGREVFVRGIVPEMSDEDEAELREDYDIEDGDNGRWELIPEAVTCGHCLEEFDTTMFGEESETELE